jgi:hypothetical protein
VNSSSPCLTTVVVTSSVSIALYVIKPYSCRRHFILLQPPLDPGVARTIGVNLSDEGGAARLDSLDLAEVNGGTTEASGKLGDVKEDTSGGRDGAQVGARGAANASLGADGLLEGAVLLGVVAVGAERGVAGSGAAVSEGLGERAAGGGRVRTGGVVNGRRNRARTNKLDHGLALSVSGSLAESASRKHCECVVVEGGKIVGERKVRNESGSGKRAWRALRLGGAGSRPGIGALGTWRCGNKEIGSESER